MSDILLKIGTISSSLTTLPHRIAKNGIGIEVKKRIKEKETYNGSYNISVLGKSKKLISLQYYNVKHADLIILQSYDQARTWWIEITGFGSTKIFEGFAYFRIDDNTTPTVAFDDTILYDFTIFIREL